MTPDGVFQSLVATYSVLDGRVHGDLGPESRPATMGSNWVFGSVASDDAYKGGGIRHNQLQVEEIELYDWQTINPDFNNKFITLYEGVQRANATLRILRGTPGLSESESNSYKGEALFLRAFYHFEAYKLWGDIPYYLEDATSFKQKNIDPIPMLENDLIQAIDLLPEDHDAYGRVTKATAQALLGKVYLYNRQYTNAKEYFDQVITSEKYQLQPSFHETIFCCGREWLRDDVGVSSLCK